MRYCINVYQNNQVKTLTVTPVQSPSFGEQQTCEYRFPRGSCNGCSIQFIYQNGKWNAVCFGGVIRAGQQVGTVPVNSGDMFIMNSATHLAVQLICLGEQAVQVPLSGLTELLIGRNSNCSLQLENRRVSGGHAKLYQLSGQWHICDINSTNGTYVNGKRINEEILREGDMILIGAYELLFSAGTLQVYGVAGEIKLHLTEEKSQKQTDAPKSNLRSTESKKANVEYPFFVLSPRLLRERPSGEIEIEPAPNIGSKPEINWLTVLLPPIGTLTLTFMVTILMSLSPMSMAFTAPMMLMGIVVAFLNYRNQTNKYIKKNELLWEKYQKYIHACEEQLVEAVRQQRDAAIYPYPGPQQCVDMALSRDRRLWERTAGDEDFLSLRMGVGEELFCMTVRAPKVGFILEEEAFTYTPQQLAEKYRNVYGVPVYCNLQKMSTLGIIGQRSQTVCAAHTLAIQAAALHSYEEVKIVVLFPEKERAQWDWMRWLPHTWSAGRDCRYLACTKYDAVQMLNQLEEELKRRSSAQSNNREWNSPLPHYLFFVADFSLLHGQPVADYLLRNDPALGVSCILLAGDLSQLPHNVLQILDARIHNSEWYYRERIDEKKIFQPDQISIKECDTFARALAPVRLPEKNSAQLLPTSVTFFQGYHVQRPDQLEIEEYWADSCNYKSMSVPIGVKANGETFYFDIHEKKHGPHGLVAGMTGSGKSEMVQSWILSMALQFSPQDVAFILIDFKGTGLILPFLDLPHLAGTISDLDTNIGRNLIALRSEVQRRKALFDSVSAEGQKVTEISKYTELYRRGKVEEPLPYLFVIIDEYAEFKVKFPDFTSEVNTLFHVGRSLGVYIILMTQNPSGVVSSESESNVKFRWCLKVANLGASKETLGGHDEAAYITNPGRAYVRVGNDEIFEPIQSFYSGAAYSSDSSEQQSTQQGISMVALNGSRTKCSQNIVATEKEKSHITQIEAVVRYIRAYTTRKGIDDAHPIWCNKMPGRIYLPQLLNQTAPHKPGELCPIIGMMDDPTAQVQRPLHLPLSSDGHVAVYGTPGSGKTVLLQTLVTSLCMEYSPEEVNLYIMDFGGWSMGIFRNFPHVAGIANDNEEDKITAVAKALETALQERKELFAREGVGNLRTYLQVSDERLPYLVLLVDNFAPVYQQYPQLESFFIQLGQMGGNYGIYLVVTAGNTMALGYKLSQSVKTCVALELTDTSEYNSVVGKTGGLIPEAMPGRGLFREERVLEFQTALPAVALENGTYVTAIRTLGEELSEKWGAVQVDSLAVMPDEICFGSVQAKNGGYVLGLDTDKVQPVEVDLNAPHQLVISGLPQSGKTTLLRTLVKQMRMRNDARVVLFADAAEYISCGDGLEILKDGEETDLSLEELSGLLKERQEQKKAQPDQMFSPIYFVIDGYKQCFGEISQQSVSRLRALLLMGAGLGVSLVVADDAYALSELVQYREPFTMLLAKEPAILLGGKPLEHMAFEIPLETTLKNKPLKKWEGWYWSSQGVQRFKAMKDE